ncbi:hypothetical protein [Rhizobium wenxiniae]|uniref:hypothetical protein n=1 Tax=Rhizobium wenxiniae TaxID=1737357 RepID=UPI003C1B009A
MTDKALRNSCFNLCGQLSSKVCRDAERQRTNEILLFSMNLEQAGDVLDQNLLPHLAKRIRRRLTFSQEGQ